MSNDKDKAAIEAAYQVEVERRFRHQTPDGKPIGDMRDCELPFKSVFASGFRAAIAHAEAERDEREPILLDCLAGKLTSWDAIFGYVSKLELQLAERDEQAKGLVAAMNYAYRGEQGE